MDILALLETLLSCMMVPLFVLGVLASIVVLLFVFDKKILRH
jgi:hypothetical protein